MNKVLYLNYSTERERSKAGSGSFSNVKKAGSIPLSIRIALYIFAVIIINICNYSYASLVRDNIPYQTFRDFAENKGPFFAGANNITIKNKKGVQVERLDKAPMPDFSSVDGEKGVATVISPQYAVSVKHNSSWHFDNLYFANGHYKMVSKDDSPAADFSLIRLNKLATEVVPADMPSGVKSDELKNNERFTAFYRIGSGIQRTISANNQIKTLAPGYQYLTGGVVGQPEAESHTLHVKYDNFFSPAMSPVTSHVLSGDSGSPLFAWDKTLKKWLIVAVTKSGNLLSLNSFDTIPVDFVNETQKRYDAKPVDNKNSNLPFLWGFNNMTGTGAIYQGDETHIMQGKKGGDLSAGNNLTFKGAEGKIILRDNVDQGAGSLTFASSYTVMPQSTQSWTGAGVYIARGAQVTWRVSGVQVDKLHKIGAGTLIVNGAGVNPGGLKAGNGVVLLAQRPDSQNRVQAFSSVNIASGRPTVVLSNDRQIDPDTISWGYRGGVLDVKGNNLTFHKINAADYGAILTNTAKKRADITLNLKILAADIPVRNWSQNKKGVPGELYHYQNSNSSTSDYFMLKTTNYSFFPVNQASDAHWEFIGHNREEAIRTVFERNKHSAYMYHGKMKGNLNINNKFAGAVPDTLIFDGSVVISGKFTQDGGHLIFQGHPVIHAYNDKDFVSQLNDTSVKVQPVSFSQPDWERRTFRLAELELNNAQFSLARNATLTGNINARNSVLQLGSPILYIDLNDGNGISNVPQKGSSVAGRYGDMSQYQGKVTLKDRSVLNINERFAGSIAAQGSRVIISSRHAQLNGYSQFLNTPLALKPYAKLTAKGGWLSDSDITLEPSSTVVLSAIKKKGKEAGPTFYTLNNGAKYLLQKGSALRVSPFVFFSGDIFSAYSSSVCFEGTDAVNLAAKLSPAEQQKADRLAGFKNVWQGSINAPRAEASLTNTRWQMQKNARVNTLKLLRSLVGFSAENGVFGTVSANNLHVENAGFVLNTDLKNSDKVVINKQATGSNNALFVEVAKSQKSPTEKRNLNIPLVIAPAGTHPSMFKAVKQVTGFSVVSPVIHVQENTDNTKWILDSFTAEPNPGTSKPASDFLNMAYKTFVAEVNNMNKRMGDLRNTQGEAGMWARSLNGTGRGEQGYSERYLHLQSGFDKKYRQQAADLFTGVLLSYTNSYFSGQSYRGNTLSLGAGLYASVIFDSGAYVDVIGKYIHHKNDYLAGFTGLGQRQYHTHSWYGGVEVGYRYSFATNIFIEPQAELTYGAVRGITLKWQDKGHEVAMQQKHFNPLIGRVGVTAGKAFSNKYGTITVRTGLDYQFDLIANGGTVLRDRSTEQHFASQKDSRMLYHVGLNGQVNDKFNVGLAVERSAFGKYNVDHAMNAHLRYQF